MRLSGGVVLTALSVLFVARFPYYRQFHSGYHQLLFNTLNDDVYALLVSLVQEFYLPARLIAALFLAYALYRILGRVWRGASPFTPRQESAAGRWLRRGLIWAAILFLGVLVWRRAGMGNGKWLGECRGDAGYAP